MSRFADDQFAYSLGRFANVSSHFTHVSLVISLTFKAILVTSYFSSVFLEVADSKYTFTLYQNDLNCI